MDSSVPNPRIPGRLYKCTAVGCFKNSLESNSPQQTSQRFLCGIHGFTVPQHYLLMIYHTCFQYVVFIVVGMGIFSSIVFHVGVKEHPRDCSAEFATKSSKRSAGNWTAWFREPLFYQVWVSSLQLETSSVRCLYVGNSQP